MAQVIDYTTDPAATWIRRSWAKLATSMASRFGSPIYLVGSALVKPSPHDFDIRVPMQEHDLTRMFGPLGGPVISTDGMYTERELRIWACNLKQSRRWSYNTGGRNIDFQIQTVEKFDSYAASADQRLRLDHFPDELFGVGMGLP